ncbi:hypothetical protein GQ457_16G016740 [Hibiscus cannabinus]
MRALRFLKLSGTWPSRLLWPKFNMVKFLQEKRLWRIKPLKLSRLVIDGELSNETGKVSLKLFERVENFSSFPRLANTSGRTPENELDEMSNSTRLER